MPVLCSFLFSAHLQPPFCRCLVESEQKKTKESGVHCTSLTRSPWPLPSLTDFLRNCTFRLTVPHARQKQHRKAPRDCSAAEESLRMAPSNSVPSNHWATRDSNPESELGLFFGKYSTTRGRFIFKIQELGGRKAFKNPK